MHYVICSRRVLTVAEDGDPILYSDNWCIHCTCHWHGEEYSTEQAARDEGVCHAIESGHQPVWEPLRA